MEEKTIDLKGSTFDERFMHEAFSQALKAFKKDEVPIGAVIVKDGKIIAKAFNKREKKQNALLHAEIICINKACKKLKSWRLNGCDIYVTIEPCSMCSGAILNSRIDNVYFGGYDDKSGCFGSLYDFSKDKRFNHHVKAFGDIFSSECVSLLKEYFSLKRAKNKSRKQKREEKNDWFCTSQRKINK